MAWFPMLARRAEGLFRLVLVAWWACLCTCPLVGAQNLQLTEDQIKAGFLFNFTKFVEWPPDAFLDPSSPIVMGIVGENPVSEMLKASAIGKLINGRAIVVKSLKDDGQDLRLCQILFVSASETKHVAQILEGVKGSSVLTVGELGGFVESGGVINFFIEDNKVRFEINLGAAARARLKISSKLIAVARLVPVDAPKGKN